jgi:hypothetical protein
MRALRRCLASVLSRHHSVECSPERLLHGTQGRSTSLCGWAGPGFEDVRQRHSACLVMPQSRWRSPPRDNPLSFFGADAPKAKTVYFAGTTDPAAAIRSIAADMTMHEPARLAAKQMTAAGQPAWLYRFDYVAESLRPTGSAEHAKKLPYLFGTLVTARAHHLDRGRVQQTGNVPSAFRRAWSRGRSMSSRVSFTLPCPFRTFGCPCMLYRSGSHLSTGWLPSCCSFGWKVRQRECSRTKKGSDPFSPAVRVDRGLCCCVAFERPGRRRDLRRP